MSATIRLGDSGELIKKLQAMLTTIGYPLRADGGFGEKTEAAVLAFQTKHKLYADGVVGPVTWATLYNAVAGKTHDVAPANTWKRVDGMVKYNGEGYTTFTLRDDVADAFTEARDELYNQYGVELTSSGSRRALQTKANSNQSATSSHYIGTAFDFFVYSGMVNPARDPFVVEADGERYWRVWARATKGVCERELLGVTYAKTNMPGYPQKVVRTAGKFVNITEYLAERDFHRIPWRKAFMHPTKQTNGAAEWWHFQNEAGLIPGVTTFGSQLLRVYRESELVGTPPWRHQALTWKRGWA